PSLGRFAGPGGWINESRELRDAGDWVNRLGIRCHSLEQAVVELSGGNQQKVVVGKWLCRDCDVLIFDEPTRGIDVGARFEIYRLLDDLARRGKAVIVVSSDLRELMAVSDRILVMSGGRIAGEFQRGEWSEDRIMTAAFSAHVGPRTSNFLLQVQPEVAVRRPQRSSSTADHASAHD
ncbi:MAG: sugar ABC transporter ATP-binding protein, partial [Verrucomicrobiae bacterium]|nr:sugar ABC transporter ATP-binding protein [Verrucomicrobiae bacterium]